VAHVLPWSAALVLAIANEAADMLADAQIEKWEREGAAHDLWNTMVLPSLLLLCSRYAPWILVRQPQINAPVAGPELAPAASQGGDPS
jgi:hypothetical protein